PTGSQDSGTNGSILQETTQIFVNGTANDTTGSGIYSISIVNGMGTALNTWSTNLGNNTNWSFTNSSTIDLDQIYWIMVNISDFAGNTFLLNCTFRVELNPPQGAQDLATQAPQNGTVLREIWINGTAFDGGSGVKNISIVTTNITGGASFTTNLGSISNWTFHNATAIPDGIWSITITIIDNADHAANISGLIIVDTIAPLQPNVSYSNPTSNQVRLNWSAVSDNTAVTYLIYRNGSLIGNTQLLYYLDIGLNPATYVYQIIPIDAAGNTGPASAAIIVTISGAGGPSNNWWWIIIVIGLAGASVSTFAIRRQRKRRSTPRPRTPLVVEEPIAEKPEVAAKIKFEEALKVKVEEAPKKSGLRFFMLEGEKLLDEPEVMLTVEEPRVTKPTAPPKKEEKPQEPKPQPKVVHFTFYCAKCKKWYGLKEYAQVNCPICQEPLKLAYECPICKKKFMVKEPGIYKCPTDGTQLRP
ncbi:MAG: hypothetical protein ACTSQI_02380, partial [Candidatus Helarchaeota archaeon]